jgi:hypothetical protein
MTIAKIAAVAAATVVLMTSFAQAGNGTIIVNKDVLRLAKVAGCVLAGGEFPNDIFVQNKGAGVLKAGQKIQWSVPFANAKGTYTLVADLAPSKSVFVADVIPGGVEAGHDCNAKAL